MCVSPLCAVLAPFSRAWGRALAITTLLWAWPGLAGAPAAPADGPAADVHGAQDAPANATREGHTPHPDTALHRFEIPHAFALRVLTASHLAEVHAPVTTGLAVHMEHPVGWGPLQVELGIAALFGPEDAHVPLTVVLKAPWRVTPGGQPVDLFAGAGAAMTAEVGTHVTFAPGVLATAGATWWLAPHWGLIGQVDAGMHHAHAWRNEVEAGVGLAFRLD